MVRICRVWQVGGDVGGDARTGSMGSAEQIVFNESVWLLLSSGGCCNCSSHYCNGSHSLISKVGCRAALTLRRSVYTPVLPQTYPNTEPHLCLPRQGQWSCISWLAGKWNKKSQSQSVLFASPLPCLVFVLSPMTRTQEP